MTKASFVDIFLVDVRVTDDRRHVEWDATVVICKVVAQKCHYFVGPGNMAITSPC